MGNAALAPDCHNVTERGVVLISLSFIASKYSDKILTYFTQQVAQMQHKRKKMCLICSPHVVIQLHLSIFKHMGEMPLVYNKKIGTD